MWRAGSSSLSLRRASRTPEERCADRRDHREERHRVCRLGVATAHATGAATPRLVRRWRRAGVTGDGQNRTSVIPNLGRSKPTVTSPRDTPTLPSGTREDGSIASCRAVNCSVDGLSGTPCADPDGIGVAVRFVHALVPDARDGSEAGRHLNREAHRRRCISFAHFA